MVTLFIFVILVSTFCEQTTCKNLIARLGYGVLFDEVDTVDMSSNYWRHSFLIRFVEPPDLELNVQDECNLTSDEPLALAKWCADFRTAILNHQSQVKYLVQNIRKHEEIFKHLLPGDKFINTNDTAKQKTHKRTKRGLVDGIGKGMRYLFGTAVDEDVQVMKSHLKFATSSYKKMKAYQNYLNSYLIKTNRRVDNAMSMLNFNHDIIQHAIRNISDYRRKISMRMDDLQTSTDGAITLTRFTSVLILRMSQLIDQLTLLQSYGERKLHATRRLLENKLPIQLVTPFDLKKLMSSVRQSLRQRYGDFHLSVDDIGQFYSQSPVAYAFDESYLAVHVKIPVSNMKSKFRVFKTVMTSAPLMTNSTQNGQRSMKVLNVSAYIAVAEDESYYVELPESDYQSCVSNSFKKCPGSVTLKPMRHMSCALALYHGSHSDIIKYCDIKYITKTLPEPMTFPLGNGSVLIRSSGKKEWKKTCTNGQQQHEELVSPCQFCVIDNSCCQLQGEDFYIPLDISTCKNNNYSTTVKLIQSIPFLSLFYTNFSGDQIKAENAKGEENADLGINLENIDLQWKMALELDKEGKTDLEMLGWLISKSSMDTMDETIDQSFIFEAYSNYFIVLFIIFGVLLSIVYVILCVAFFKARSIVRKQQNATKTGKFGTHV